MIQTIHDTDLIQALERLLDSTKAKLFRECLKNTPKDLDEDEILETVNDTLELINAPFEIMEIAGKENGFYIWKIMIVNERVC